MLLIKCVSYLKTFAKVFIKYVMIKKYIDDIKKKIHFVIILCIFNYGIIQLLNISFNILLSYF